MSTMEMRKGGGATIASARGNKTRKMAMTAMLSAVGVILMYLSFNVPLMPSFIKMDFSELPALIAAYAFGPVSGIIVCLVKNLVNLLFTTTVGIGELSNFLLGVAFVLPAGLIYKRRHDKKHAFIGSLIGAVAMALFSLVSNYFVIYPLYAALGMPMEAIIGMYQAINPNVHTLMDALLMFNLPFTFLKGMASVLITFVIYKKISPLLKGRSAS